MRSFGRLGCEGQVRLYCELILPGSLGVSRGGGRWCLAFLPDAPRLWLVGEGRNGIRREVDIFFVAREAEVISEDGLGLGLKDGAISDCFVSLPV